MKYARKAIRGIIAASVLSFSLVRPLIAQQEVSPDHFDAAPVQSTQASKAAPKANDRKVASNRAAKKHVSKVQHTRPQTASLKRVSG